MNLLYSLLLAAFLAVGGCDSADRGATSPATPEKTPPAVASGAAASTPDAQAPDSAAASESSIAFAVPADEPAAPALPDAGEAERADAVLAFYNGAVSALGEGRYGQGDAIRVFAEFYAQEWQLAKLPPAKHAEDKNLARSLVPPEILFSLEERAALAECVSRMDRALDSMRADYRALERYMNDASVQDDGNKGRNLVTSLRAGHADFAGAREEFLNILEPHAAAAGELLLRGHPLKRQIQAAERMFALFRKVAVLLAPEKPDNEGLAALHAQLSALLADAAKPPFRAVPGVEMAYRAFLHKAGAYAHLLGQGLEEGFYAPRRQEMNLAAGGCHSAYNVFVHAANSPQAILGRPSGF